MQLKIHKRKSLLITNTSTQREILKQQISLWPASKQDLIFKYWKEFSAFVESIDFELVTECSISKPNQTNQEIIVLSLECGT